MNKQKFDPNVHNRLHYKSVHIDKRAMALMEKLKETTRMPVNHLLTVVLAAAGFESLVRNDVTMNEYVVMVKNVIKNIDPTTDELVREVTKKMEQEKQKLMQ